MKWDIGLKEADLFYLKIDNSLENLTRIYLKTKMLVPPSINPTS